jgi:RimJ/RimL family protein N-acetyltransferase
MTLSFKLLSSDDFPLMLEWLSRRHVREWWNDGDDTLEKVAAHYEKKRENVARFIMIDENNTDKKTIGFIQYYFAPDNEIGIDLFIGEEIYLNRGIGRKAISSFIEFILERHEPASFIIDPSPENKRAIRCYEKAGFRHFETKSGEDGKPAYMMRLDRREKN